MAARSPPLTVDVATSPTKVRTGSSVSGAQKIVAVSPSKLEVKLANAGPNKNIKFRVLSIDGGGIRGIIPARILHALETRIRSLTHPKARLIDYFDMICGTSTGGILSMSKKDGSTSPPTSPTSGPRTHFTTEEVMNLYVKNGHRIFNRTLRQKIMTLGGVGDEKYKSDGLEKMIKEHAGDLWLSELLKPCLITAYDIEKRESLFMCQQSAKKRDSGEFKVLDAALATSAAPTYFEPHRFKSKSGEVYSAVDGGITANNPAMCAFTEAMKMGLPIVGRQFHPEEIALLSIGTGDVKVPIPYEQAKDWGLLKWVQPIIDLLFGGASNAVDYELRTTFKAAGANDQYVRLQPLISKACEAMDDVSEENVKRLLEIGAKTAEENDTVLADFCRKCLVLDR